MNNKINNERDSRQPTCKRATRRATHAMLKGLVNASLFRRDPMGLSCCSACQNTPCSRTGLFVRLTHARPAQTAPCNRQVLANALMREGSILRWERASNSSANAPFHEVQLQYSHVRLQDFVTSRTNYLHRRRSNNRLLNIYDARKRWQTEKHMCGPGID